MAIPLPSAKPSPAATETSWTQLDAAGKRSRLIAVSREVFARDGLEAPMPAIAAAAGVGVGSIYRQFPSKRDLLAALVVERLEEVRVSAEAALASEAGPWSALIALLWDFGERQGGDDVLAEAMACVLIDPLVAGTRARTNEVLADLLAAAKAEGRLRADATTVDLRLIFAAARAAEKVEPDSWRRMLELGIDSLEA